MFAAGFKCAILFRPVARRSSPNPVSSPPSTAGICPVIVAARSLALRRGPGQSLTPPFRPPPRFAVCPSAPQALPFDSSVYQLPRILIARAPTTTIVASDIELSTIISILARDVSGMTSVVLNAVAVE